MKAQFAALLEGSIGWRQFFTHTKDDWERLANHVYRRWKLPAGIDVEDVEQHLKTEVVVAFEKWEPGRSKAHAFVVWTAITQTKKWLHSQRKALRRDGKAPSRAPIPFSEFEIEPEEAIDAEQEEVAEQLAKVGDALRQLDELSQHVLLAILLTRGDLDAAADDVYEDKALRRVLRLGSVAHAKRVVRRVADEATQAMVA